jgi:murein DD-endopeptidase MepM/ murein hydrolase activator NlpD
MMQRREFMLFSWKTALAGACLGSGALAASSLFASQAQAAQARPSGASGTPLRLACPAEATVGQAFELRVQGLPPEARVAVDWDGHRIPLPVEADGGQGQGAGQARALLGLDVNRWPAGTKSLTREAVVSVESGGGRRELRQSVRLSARTYPSEKLTLPEAMVTPPNPEVEARIRAEREAVERVLSRVGARRLWDLPLTRPVPGIVLSPYGFRRILNGKPKAPHRGLDFRGTAGTPVAACARGEVVLAAEHYYSGRSVYLDHGGGVFSMYFHLAEISVREGETTARGAVIGAVGQTGRATGPHLHLSLRVPGGLVDPAPLLG